MNKMKEEQITKLKKIFSSKNFFLINRPQKDTSFNVVKKLVEKLYSNEKTNILLLANKGNPTDELCDAVNDAIINFDDVNDGKVNYGRSDRNFIRIDDESSCSQEHKHNLFSNISKNLFTKSDLNVLNKLIARNDPDSIIKKYKLDDEFTTAKLNLLKKNDLVDIVTKSKIKDFLPKHSIFISTIKSIIDFDQDFLEMIKFDIIIVNEVSQIPELHLINIAERFDSFIFNDYSERTYTIKSNISENSSLLNSLNTFFKEHFQI